MWSKVSFYRWDPTVEISRVFSKTIVISLIASIYQLSFSNFLKILENTYMFHTMCLGLNGINYDNIQRKLRIRYRLRLQKQSWKGILVRGAPVPRYDIIQN